MKKLTTTLLMVALLGISVYGYGPRGHGLVGAIADKRLATNPTIKTKVDTLLDGLTLQQAATLPDSIKTWDTRPDGFHVTGHPTIETQLRAFVAANPAGGKPSHHDFHFTDVPVAGDETYASGTVGREPFDIVHMIPFCIRVLKGEEPETNDRAITKAVAVILLVHYMGDIHQPLHVGAEYFTSKGKPFEPSETNLGFADQGGNKLTLFLLSNGKATSAKGLHGYWDGQSVTTAFGSTPDDQVAQKLASSQPPNWKLTGGVETWAEQLANDILPIARTAHTRLSFTLIKSTKGKKDIDSGRATEKKTTGLSYKNFAGVTVSNEIQKAGWRLAALLEEALK
ncbi:MAG TPA: S1/P1 nuclease [Blastocatellia bacterium]|nr:S1/P1 nuclease [Blastocatellia bacterium]